MSREFINIIVVFLEQFWVRAFTLWEKSGLFTDPMGNLNVVGL